MSLFTKKFFYGIALTIAAIAFLGCSQPVDPPADITWTAEADGSGGTTTSTKINVTFAGAVTGLTAEQITLTNGTGAATKGAISGDGANWSLGITVETAGDITIAIDKTGVESGAKTVTVHKQAAAPAPVAYTVTADGASGATTSTKIDFVFNAVIEGLTTEQITLTNGTGAVTKGDLTGSDASWSLEITVETAGDLTVAINKTGVESGAKTLTVHKQGEATPDPVAYTVTADGASGVTTSTKIDFTFAGAIAELTAEEIILTNGTGAVTKGALTGSDTSWSLEITVDNAGDIKVSINKPGIENTEKELTVHKGEPAPELTAAVSPIWGNTGDEWAKGSISGEGETQTITLSVVEEPQAYVGISKTADQTITVGGADEAKVTRLANGEPLGSQTASDTAALFTVNMEDLLFDGAFGESGSFDADTIPIGTETRAFTLTVSEDDKEPRIITVNLNITLDPDTETSIYHREGAGTSEDPYYYVKVRDAELPNTDIVNASFTAFESGEVKDLQNAFVWVDRYGEGGASNTGFANGTTEGYSEYRLFLKKSQKIGKMGLQFTNSDSDTRDHMSVELYGAGQPGSKELKITRDDGYSTDIQLQMLNYISSIEGFISLRGIKYATLVLGKNITIDAEGISTDINTQFLSAGGGTWRSMLVSYLIYVEQQKEMIIMHDYSKLTGCYVPISSHLYCPIYLGWPSTSIAATMSKLHLYGGAITGNIVGGIIIHGKPLENSYPAVVLHKDKAIDTIIFDNTNIEGVVVNRINRN